VLELAPFSDFSEQVVKASSGHFPLPFLIRDVKNWCKITAAFLYFQIIFIKSTKMVDFLKFRIADFEFRIWVYIFILSNFQIEKLFLSDLFVHY
jgi:hypothetical protein